MLHTKLHIHRIYSLWNVSGMCNCLRRLDVMALLRAAQVQPLHIFTISNRPLYGTIVVYNVMRKCQRKISDSIEKSTRINRTYFTDLLPLKVRPKRFQWKSSVQV